jgi:integrase
MVRDGVWRAWRARQHRSDGTSVRPSATFYGPEAQARAQRWAAGDPEPATMYVGQWLERWLALREPRLRVRSREAYRSHVAWCGALLLRPLADVSEDDWQLRANELLETFARDTVRNWRATISSALKAAVPRFLPANPMDRVELPKRNERVVRAFTAAELTTFLRAVVGHRYEVWVHLSLGTGLRLSESRGLTWDRVDLAEQTILVDSALDQVSHERGPTKSGRIRTVDLSSQLVAMLAAHRARQAPGERYVIGSGQKGQPVAATTLRDFVRRVCRDNGLRGLSPHSLRHAHASLLIMNGVSVPEVAQALGHSSPTITMNTYAHVINASARRGATAIGKAMEELMLEGVASLPPVERRTTG